MPKLTDETLMLYADGLLDTSDRGEVEKHLAEDRELRARLQVFRLTGRELADLLEDHVNAPAPNRLRDFVLEHQGGYSHDAGLYRHLYHLPKSWLKKLRVTEVWSFETASIAGVAIIAGFALGWAFRGDTPSNATALSDLIQIDRNRLFAREGLAQALEMTPSRQKVALALAENRKIDLEIRMTFRDEARHYCRQYEISMAAAERYIGIACRIGAQWSVEFQALTASQRSVSDGIIPAGGGNSLAMDAAVSALIDGEPLTREDEAAILKDGWTK